MNIESKLSTFNFQLSTKSPKGLYSPIAYSLEAGGKRIRPTLALLASQIWNAPEEDVMPAALALEVFHTFTLLHDDVMDNASTRRGRDCVHVKWNANTAILSGDQMLIEAYRLLSQIPEWAVPGTLRLFNDMATEVCEGQQLDMDFETYDPLTANRSPLTVTDYMLMIAKKTSALLAYALRIGAYIAKAPQEAQMALFRFGMALGKAFQIQDDYLDCFGTEETLGKAIGGDIREHKKTYLYLTALESRLSSLSDSVPSSLSDSVPSSLSDSGLLSILNSGDFEAVTALYRELKVDQLAQEAVADLTRQAIAELDTLPDTPARTQLIHLASQLIHRKN
ncbi:MAG: polyprenyl synthetase family protein [Paludibacteraceae bacterium]|nr:polyprenyl synthetase family protein [Paludibacteraceae bacterium]